MLPKDYVAYKMSGQFASDVSDSSGTLYFDVEHKK
jgi:xylulokinase